MAWRGGSMYRPTTSRASRRRRVGRQLEAAHPMRRQARLLQISCTWRGRCRSPRPWRAPSSGWPRGRRLVQGTADHLGDLGRAQGRDPRRPGPIAQQPVDAGREVALRQRQNEGLDRPGPAHDLGGAEPIRASAAPLQPARHASARCFDQRRSLPDARDRRSHEQAKIPSHPSTIAQLRCKGNLCQDKPLATPKPISTGSSQMFPAFESIRSATIAEENAMNAIDMGSRSQSSRLSDGAQW